MDVMEKLVELIRNAHKKCKAKKTCHECEQYGNGSDCVYLLMADELITNGITVQEWIPVTERLPEEKVNCIVHYRHAYCDNDDYFAIGVCFYDGEKFQLNPAYKVANWMPIPQPPKGE